MVACNLPGKVVIMEGLTVQGHVATTKEPILYNTAVKDDRFPAGLGEATSVAQSVLGLPLLREDRLFGVVVFSRTPHSAPFSEEEEKVKTVFYWYLCMYELLQTCKQWFDRYISNLCPAVNPVSSCDLKYSVMTVFVIQTNEAELESDGFLTVIL